MIEIDIKTFVCQDNKSDVYVSGLKDRNRALNGDIVVISMYPREHWKVCPIKSIN